MRRKRQITQTTKNHQHSCYRTRSEPTFTLLNRALSFPPTKRENYTLDTLAGRPTPSFRTATSKSKTPTTADRSMALQNTRRRPRRPFSLAGSVIQSSCPGLSPGPLSHYTHPHPHRICFITLLFIDIVSRRDAPADPGIMEWTRTRALARSDRTNKQFQCIWRTRVLLPPLLPRTRVNIMAD